jgi:hypothetical protein
LCQQQHVIVLHHVATDCDATGYKGMNNDPNKEWVMEAKDGEQFEEGSDPFLAKSRAKKEAMQVLFGALWCSFVCSRFSSFPPTARLFTAAAETRQT